MIVNVCPSAATSATPDQVWSVLVAPERFGEWMDAHYVGSEPPGPVKPGQTIHLAASWLGREWPIWIGVRDLDPQHRWMDLLVRLPFGIHNHEHLTLSETKPGGTLIRLN